MCSGSKFKNVTAHMKSNAQIIMLHFCLYTVYITEGMEQENVRGRYTTYWFVEYSLVTVVLAAAAVCVLMWERPVVDKGQLSPNKQWEEFCSDEGLLLNVRGLLYHSPYSAKLNAAIQRGIRLCSYSLMEAPSWGKILIIAHFPRHSWQS